MASTKEIQNRIKSIQDTRKITNAMYMISSTKLKKARKKLEQTEPYFYALQAAIARILRHLPPETKSVYFHSPHEEVPPEQKKRALVVVCGDKGLAGAFNHNIFKEAQKWLSEPGDNKLYVIGEVGRQYFLSRKQPVEQAFRYTAQNPTMSRARSISGTLLEKFLHGEADEVWVIFTNMESGISSQVERVKLLPLERKTFGPAPPIGIRMEEFVMLPTPEAVMDAIVPNYIKGFLYCVLVESFCSEQNARMIAMENATDSADEMLRFLSVAFNRARQAAITQEITEIIGGAKAQKKKKEAKKKMRREEIAG